MALAPTLKRAEGKHWGDVHNQFLYRMEPRRPRITEGHSVSYMLTTSNGSQQLPGEPDNHVMDELSARGPGARCLGLLASQASNGRFLLEVSKSTNTLATVLFEFRDSPTMLLKVKYLGATWRV